MNKILSPNRVIKHIKRKITRKDLINLELPEELPDLKIKDKIPLYFENLSEKDENKIISYADKILKNTVNLFNAHEVDLGHEIEWDKDYLNNSKWDKDIFIFDIKTSKKRDVRIGWELNRLQFLPILALAYRITNDDKYYRKIKGLISSWKKNNPYPYGISWSSGLEIAIRSINLIWVLIILDEEREIGELVKSVLYRGGCFLDEITDLNLNRNNHRIGEYSGLLHIGLIFENDEWIEKGLSKFESEIEHQVYEEGVDHEGSLNYHKFVTEFLVLSKIIVNNFGYQFNSSVKERLSKMLNFVEWYTFEDGTAPNFGDSDDAKVLDFLVDNDHTFLLGIGGYKGAKTNGWWKILRKRWGKDILDNKQYFRFYEKSGYFIYKKKGTYLFINLGLTEKPELYGHRHNDVLSFILRSYGETIFCDSGTYSYQKERNKFRSVKSHNTLSIDDLEHNPLPDKRKFSMDEYYSTVKDRIVQEREEKILLKAENLAYKRINNPIYHQRKFIISDQKIKIIDEFDLHDNGLNITYILKEERVKKSEESNFWNYELKDKEFEVKISKTLKQTMQETKISENYNQKRKGFRLILKPEIDQNMVKTTIYLNKKLCKIEI